MEQVEGRVKKTLEKSSTTRTLREGKKVSYGRCHKYAKEGGGLYESKLVQCKDEN